MRIDWPVIDAWEKLSEQYRSFLPFQDSAVNVQIYNGYQHALWEITHALAELFSHKQTIAVPALGEPAIERIAVAFSAKGYNVISLTREQIAEPSWLDAAQSELLFVVLPQDDAVTGELYDYTKLNEALKDKRIFRIQLSHAKHRFEAINRPALFESHILSLTPDRALFVAGERHRIQPPITRLLPWPADESTLAQESMRVFSESEITQMKKDVQAFEGSLPEGFHSYFNKKENRLYDRALFWHPEIDGLSLIDELASQSGVQMQAPGQNTQFETTSTCRWQSPRYYDELIKRGFKPESIRGLCLARANIATQSLSDRLQSAANKILQIQNG